MIDVEKGVSINSVLMEKLGDGGFATSASDARLRERKKENKNADNSVLGIAANYHLHGNVCRRGG